MGKGECCFIFAQAPSFYCFIIKRELYYEQEKPAKQEATIEPLVEIKDVEKCFGHQEVLRHIDFVLEPGLITGLLGPSGCGKTTLVNIIIGSIKETKGTVMVLGQAAPPNKVRHEIGFMPQSQALYTDLTADENLRFFGSLYGLAGKQLDSAISRVLSLVHLADEGKKIVEVFSGGMKRRLSLAIALLHQPRLLVLDEPTVGLDPLHRIELWRSFRELANNGAGLLITTHVMDEAASCDRLIMLHNGLILTQGSPEEIISRAGTKTLEEAFLSFEKQTEEEARDA